MWFIISSDSGSLSFSFLFVLFRLNEIFPTHSAAAISSSKLIQSACVLLVGHKSWWANASRGHISKRVTNIISSHVRIMKCMLLSSSLCMKLVSRRRGFSVPKFLSCEDWFDTMKASLSKIFHRLCYAVYWKRVKPYKTILVVKTIIFCKMTLEICLQQGINLQIERE